MKDFLTKILYLFDNKKQRTYVSSLSKFLSDFDKNHPRSKSQIKESLKHRDIFRRKITHD